MPAVVQAVKFFRSIEFRLTAWYAALLFAGFLALSLVSLSVVRRAVQSAVDDQLEGRLQRLTATITSEVEEDEEEGEEFHQAEFEEDLVDYARALPESHLIQIRGPGGQQVFPSEEEVLAITWPDPTLKKPLYTTEALSLPHRVLMGELAVKDQRYPILLGSSLTILEDVKHRMLVSFLIVAPVALAICCGGGLFIARGALRPVDEITQAASVITLDQLSRRIASRDTGDALERLTKTFNAMLQRLETSVWRLEHFSADASHELRTPVAIIRTTAELALQQARSEEGYRADFANIRDESIRLGELIEVLLTLSRDGGEKQVAKSHLDLRTLVANVCRSYEPAVRSKGLTLERKLPEGVVPFYGNEPALRRMLGSLVENAVAHTSQGSISIGLSRNGERLQLQVEDTGEGIPPQALERIFDRLYRVDRSRSRESGRLGLGLSIAQRIAELHDGQIAVESELGKGSAFTITLPQLKEPAES